MWKKLSITLCIGSLALLAWCLRLRSELEAEKASADVSLQALTQELKKLSALHAALENSCADAMPDRTPKSNVSTTQPANPVETQPLVRRNLLATPSPELVPGMNLQDGMRLNLINSLMLRDDERVKMVRILSEEQRKFRAARSANPGRELDQATAEAIRSETDQQVFALLGSERYREFDDYRQFPAEYSRVSVFNERLRAAAQTSLSPRVRGLLLSTLREEAAVGPSSGEAAVYAEWRETYERRVQERVARFLTREQMSLFKTER